MMLPSITVRVFLLMVALTIWASPASSTDAKPGDYAGWAYFDAGFDLPLRVHLKQLNNGEFTATIDLPVYEEGGIGGATVESNDGAIQIEFSEAVGFKIALHLKVEGDVLTGTTTWTGSTNTYPGEVQLHRSALPLPWVPAADLPDATGTYALAPGRTIIVTRRDWGELFYTDPYTGRSGFLFAQTPEQLFAGGRVYVPTEVAATISLETDDAGAVSRLRWQDEGGPLMSAQPTAFHTETLTFESEGTALFGRITRLPGSQARPGVVVIGGSDWDDSSRLGRYAETFAALGLTVLTFDKRGHAGSGGEEDASFDTIAADLIAAAELLAARADVIDGQVGLFGYSRGGWHIPLASTKSEAIDFAVIFVPPAVSPAMQETTRRLGELQEAGVTDSGDLAIAEEYLNAIWAYAKSADDGDQYLAMRADIEKRGWIDILSGPETLDEDEWRWARLNMHYDPVPALSAVQCPILAVFGGADPNVTPEQNVPIMRRAFQDGRVADATIKIIEGVDHGLRIVPSEGMMTRYHASQSYPADLWPLVYDWLAQHVDLEND